MTHNQDEAHSLSDRIAVLRKGRVEQVLAGTGRPFKNRPLRLRASTVEQMGTLRELFERPANAFVARFVGLTQY